MLYEQRAQKDARELRRRRKSLVAQIDHLVLIDQAGFFLARISWPLFYCSLSRPDGAFTLQGFHGDCSLLRVSP